ncbi:sodium:proton antiporter [Termitidicoccus mucosus]|uniref:Sodium:proton antiporter n=1 Tax=Termitidicoccus mucosus TaxID=1184151 RepID=A0A178ILS3_9BACT|nr:sodium:proton antiporter [Opitutaceae bacterium TSB47]
MTCLPLLASASGAAIPLALIIPFVLLLMLIAVMPLMVAKVKHWWEHRYPFVAIGLGLLVVVYYLLRIPGGGETIAHTLEEYFSFICLIGALFTVAGGIHIKVKGSATPVGNIVFLAVGAVLANFIGTTGASMVLIRPWLRMNKIRLGAYHVIFFIFIVSNAGGALTPIGDPPLFLGYLRGVPFFWLIEHVFLIWLLVIGLILAVFFAIDFRAFKKTPSAVQSEIGESDTWRFEGGLNLLFLLVIIGAVFLPAKFFLREIVMLAAAAGSYFSTPRAVHAQNEFNFGPIREVAFLFAGIFMTMMPALGYLEQHGQEFGFKKPAQYYFAAGSLSSVLDNAPTYVNFLELAETTVRAEEPAAFAALGDEKHAAVRLLLERRPLLVIAVSLGAVFFGAMTYIGNGPNFMVKSIAESSGVRMPTFFGYILKYSLPFLLPILALVGWLFL